MQDLRFRFCDRYWSRILNDRYDYEEEIEVFLKSVADIRYTFVDCGANFGYWSVLASSEPFGRQTVLAIEASPDNAARLALNAGLNGNRYRCVNAAIGGNTGGFVRVAGRRHEAFSTYAVADDDHGAVRRISLDGLLGGALDAQAPTVIKLDVEGVEIEAIEGAKNLLSGDETGISLFSRYSFSISFSCDPARAKTLVGEAKTPLNQLAEQGPSPEELSKFSQKAGPALQRCLLPAITGIASC